MARMTLCVLSFAIVAASPAFANQVLVVVDGPQAAFRATHEAVRAAGHEPVDVTGVHQRLFALLGMPGLDLNNDTPPMGWPAKLKGAWDEVHAACGARRTQPTYTLQDREAWMCSQEAAYALWQLFLDEHKAGAVLVLKATETRKRDSTTWKVKIETYARGATSRRVVEDSGSSVTHLIPRNVKLLLAGGGQPQRRLTTRTLPKNHVPAEGAAVVPPRPLGRAKPATLPEGCSAPAALALRGDDTVAGILSGIYLASVPESARQGPPLSCDLTWFVGNPETSEMFSGGSMRSFGALLRCGEGRTFRGRALGISPETAFDGRGGTQIVERVLQEVCAAK